MTQLVLVSSVAAIAGLIVGAMIFDLIFGKRMRRRMGELGGEVARLHNVAASKLAGDDPDLKTLLRDFNSAVEKTYRAVDAMENQVEMTKRKSDAAKEVISSSQYILNMLEDYGADVPSVKAPQKEKQPTIELTPDKKAKLR
ncbi:MAG: hypothetical protein HKN14_08030 [Marinicaulis sp.]|nr:hypothetical protein [Marinicaulis sp.]NNE40852.1 hypothetical protein [Marinicaulis sp.]NNL87728.1 hypothetical protein [Marinicaulis sp.]